MIKADIKTAIILVGKMPFHDKSANESLKKYILTVLTMFPSNLEYFSTFDQASDLSETKEKRIKFL